MYIESMEFELGYDVGAVEVTGVFDDITGGCELPCEARLTLSMSDVKAATSGRAPKAPRLLLGGRTPIGKWFWLCPEVDEEAEVAAVDVAALGISSLG